MLEMTHEEQLERLDEIRQESARQLQTRLERTNRTWLQAAKLEAAIGRKLFSKWDLQWPGLTINVGDFRGLQEFRKIVGRLDQSSLTKHVHWNGDCLRCTIKPKSEDWDMITFEYTRSLPRKGDKCKLITETETHVTLVCER